MTIPTEPETLFGSKWYFICSRHQKYQEDCLLCSKGQWVSNWNYFWGGVQYWLSPTIWRWKANRKWGKHEHP